MENRSTGLLASASTRLLLKVVVYYVILLLVGWFVANDLPTTSGFGAFALQPILESGVVPASKHAVSAAAAVAVPPGAAAAVAAAMIAAMLLSLPVAWIYQLTRAKRGYQQSVVQLLIILPLVVAGVVILVKNSLALAFSLAGIVAAVRFRNSLDDSKDAVYVFLATGVGLAAAVDIPVAVVISMLFNAAVLMLWYTDFGNAPMELEGSIAEKRLKRAKDLAKTGTFVAQIDNEVFRNMTREQLEGIAQKALTRARGGESAKEDGRPETCLRIRTRDVSGTRRGLDLVLGEFAKGWREGAVTIDTDGLATIDYFVQLKKKTQPEELVTLAKTAGGAELVDAEIR
jgi:hypothetical protein